MRHLSDKNIAFIGSGNMAGAIIQALLEAEELDPHQIMASDPSGEQRAFVESQYGVQTTADNSKAVQKADIVILSVKPQVLNDVLSELKGSISPACLVFSIVAGQAISSIISRLDHHAVIRSMPNTPAQVGKGMTVWTASEDVTEDQREQARIILNAMGEELYVDQEDTIDMATAVSGTGPTYIFLVIEALVDAAVHLGFSRRDARKIVLQTVLGSVTFAQRSDQHLAQLRNMVTSPGGTSAEAIYQLEKGGLRTILSKAVWAAYQKSCILGKEIEEPLNAPIELENE
ncbi:MAG: pyrroline-5-carboxylate reductase [Anaerolineales bacterium]|nr:pyrroline-5-carboxylate reductase [Anaerolineales bacterium]